MIRNVVSYVSETVSSDIIYKGLIYKKAGEYKMNKQTILAFLFVAMLLPLASAVNALTVTIDQPASNSLHLDNDVILKAHMDDNGSLKYKLDSNSEVVVCNNCSNFQVTLNDLSNGNHTVIVTGTKDNITDDATVTFKVNETENLVVNILQPSNNSLHLQDDVILRASMNALGSMKYKLDSNADVTACTNCSNFQVTLNNLADGQHTVIVTGTSGSKADDASVAFRVNTTSTTTTVPSNVSGEPRFSLGFQKLPQQFASGEISEAELKSILESNKLNPGILNRLAKTGKLTSSLIDTITDTQFLPAGIAGKLLGVLGFGRNSAVESLVKNYNLTDEQLANLIQHSELPNGAIKKLLRERNLGQRSISSLIENQELKPGTIKQLIETKTLTSSNVNKLIEKQNLNKKIVATLIEQQLLDNETIRQIKQYGNGNIEKQLGKFQEIQEKKESKGKPEKAAKRQNIGKQKGKS